MLIRPLQTCARTHTYTHTHTYTYTYTYRYRTQFHTCINVYTHRYIHAHAHTDTHAHTCAQKRTLMSVEHPAVQYNRDITANSDNEANRQIKATHKATLQAILRLNTQHPARTLRWSVRMHSARIAGRHRIGIVGSNGSYVLVYTWMFNSMLGQQSVEQPLRARSSDNEDGQRINPYRFTVTRMPSVRYTLIRGAGTRSSIVPSLKAISYVLSSLIRWTIP